MPQDNKFTGASEIQPNGPRRNGQYEWHNENCQVRIGQTDSRSRTIWCVTHGQWASEVPVTVTYEYADGTKVVRDRKEPNAKVTR